MGLHTSPNIKFIKYRRIRIRENVAHLRDKRNEYEMSVGNS
jgi:hypothetical protein